MFAVPGAGGHMTRGAPRSPNGPVAGVVPHRQRGGTSALFSAPGLGWEQASNQVEPAVQAQ